MLKCVYTAATACGGRRENQDNMRVDAEPLISGGQDAGRSGSCADQKIHVFCVCDGIGAEDGGAEAARLALEAVNRSLWEARWDVKLPDLVFSAAEAAQKEVADYFWEQRWRGGTTLCMAAVRQEQFFFLNVGDSPAFLYSASDGTCRELSLRHNLATRKAASGQTVLPWDANFLTAYLGDYRMDLRNTAHTCEGRLAPGDALLLCTDGISGGFIGDALREAIKQGFTAGDMVSRAAARPDSDNCTAILLRFFDETQREERSDSRQSKL